MAHFKKYSSSSEKRYAFVRVKWQISVQPLHNIIILLNWDQKLERRLFLLEERIFALNSKYVRYKQRNTVYSYIFINFQLYLKLWLLVHRSGCANSLLSVSKVASATN